MPRWLILEPRHEGHRLWYVQMLVREIVALGEGHSAVVATTQDAAESAQWTVHLSDVEPVVVPGAAAGLSAWYRRALALSAGTHAVLIPDGEPALRTLASSPSRIPRTALIMRPLPQPGGLGFARYLAKMSCCLAARVVSGGRTRIAYLSPRPGQRVPALERLGGSAVADPTSFAPVETSAAAWREQHGIAATSAIYLVAGAVSERKSAPEIVRAFAVVAHRTRGHLVLAGSHDDATVEALEGLDADARSRVLSIDRYLSDQELDTWIVQADVLLLLYSNLGSSGLLLKALAGDVRVVARTDSDLYVSAVALGLQPEGVSHDASGIESVFLHGLDPSVSRPTVDLEVLTRPDTFARELIGISPGHVSP